MMKSGIRRGNGRGLYPQNRMLKELLQQRGTYLDACRHVRELGIEISEADISGIVRGTKRPTVELEVRLRQYCGVKNTDLWPSDEVFEHGLPEGGD